ncbi:MAG: virulence protein [Christensenellaceae bacterium]|nr:virulence protein [Christensenellaceae bacterium]
MKIRYNVTGTERKSLVAAISQELNAPAKYLGMPTAAYEVGNFHIDKAGTVTGPDNRDLVAGLCGLHDFKAVSEDYDECPDIDQHHPGRYAAPNVPPTEAMLKHAEAWMEGQPEYEDLKLTEREELGLRRERREDWQGENGMQPSDVPAPEDDTREAESGGPGRLIIEVPLKGFTPEKLDNLTKMLNAKASLLKAALGAEELPIQIGEETIRFPWFRGDTDGDHAQAYAVLISFFCKTALKKKRVTAKEKDVEGSPKYAMRCFLLSLGFIGDEYKAARKILLSKLEGNSSWKNGKRTEVADDE